MPRSLADPIQYQAHHLLRLSTSYTHRIHTHLKQDVPPQPGAPIATIGAGTGLGECFLTPGEGGHYVAYPSEGGHAEFPPRTETEVSQSVRAGLGFLCG